MTALKDLRVFGRYAGLGAVIFGEEDAAVSSSQAFTAYKGAKAGEAAAVACRDEMSVW